MSDSPCRCGHTDGPHLCHRCHTRPGTVRYYEPTRRYSIAGAQNKASVVDTVACDECWAEFMVEARAFYAAERGVSDG